VVGREVGVPKAGFALFGFYYHEACLPSWMQNLCPLHLPACASLPLTLFSPYSLVAQMVKNLPAMWKICVRSLGQEGPLEKGMATHSIFLPGESHGQRSLASYSPWAHKESDMTERLTHKLLISGSLLK